MAGKMKVNGGEKVTNIIIKVNEKMSGGKRKRAVARDTRIGATIGIILHRSGDTTAVGEVGGGIRSKTRGTNKEEIGVIIGEAVIGVMIGIIMITGVIRTVKIPIRTISSSSIRRNDRISIRRSDDRMDTMIMVKKMILHPRIKRIEVEEVRTRRNRNEEPSEVEEVRGMVPRILQNGRVVLCSNHVAPGSMSRLARVQVPRT